MYTTYGIVDPETRLFVYVGQSGRFDERKRQHLTTHRKKTTRHKKGSLQAWLVQAHAAGITPAFVTLEIVETEALSIESENNWVEKLAAIRPLDADHAAESADNLHRELAPFHSPEFNSLGQWCITRDLCNTAASPLVH